MPKPTSAGLLILLRSDSGNSEVRQIADQTKNIDSEYINERPATHVFVLCKGFGALVTDREDKQTKVH